MGDIAGLPIRHVLSLVVLGGMGAWGDKPPAPTLPSHAPHSLSVLDCGIFVDFQRMLAECGSSPRFCARPDHFLNCFEMGEWSTNEWLGASPAPQILFAVTR